MMSDSMILFSVLLACPALAILVNCIAGRKKAALSANLASLFIGLGFITSLVSLICLSFIVPPGIHFLINLNNLSLILCSLILFVSFVVHRFSIRYMDGDKLYSRYFFTLAAITLSAMLTALADNLYLFWFCWSLSNLFLIVLMVHKSQWSAAKNSGWLTLKTLLPGSVSLLVAFVLINLNADTSSIQVLTQQPGSTFKPVISLAAGLITLTALTQSALWPFHRWLISSLNSPTPVSALMHAGLVNGGGILIVKFAPLFAMNRHLLMLLFILGAVSALLGTAWKLVQTDIKRMLACSTLAQMGFMMMQCGLGLFAAAIAHLCWHGLFKAYLFLSSGSAVKQKRHENRQSAQIIPFSLSCVGGVLAMLTFAFSTGKPVFSLQVTSFLLAFAFIAGTQLMLTLIDNRCHIRRVITGAIMASLSGALYGGSICLIESLLPDLTLLYTHQSNMIHGLVLAIFVSLWALFNLGLLKRIKQSNLWYWLYMSLMNTSQPAPETITTSRSSYHY